MAKGVPEEKIEVVYNWVDENAITPVKDEENELFEEFGISRDKFRVVYAGNLGNAQNIEIIVNAARRLKDNKQIEFIIFGKGGLEDEIKAAKAKEQLDNLKILPCSLTSEWPRCMAWVMRASWPASRAWAARLCPARLGVSCRAVVRCWLILMKGS
jgi:glycosyltransferase involved in cell wall biosynthesis